MKPKIKSVGNRKSVLQSIRLCEAGLRNSKSNSDTKEHFEERVLRPMRSTNNETSVEIIAVWQEKNNDFE